MQPDQHRMRLQGSLCRGCILDALDPGAQLVLLLLLEDVHRMGGNTPAIILICSHSNKQLMSQYNPLWPTTNTFRRGTCSTKSPPSEHQVQIDVARRALVDRLGC